MAATADDILSLQKQQALDSAAALKAQNTTLKATQLESVFAEPTPTREANTTEAAVNSLRAQQQQILQSSTAEQLIAASTARAPGAAPVDAQPQDAGLAEIDQRIAQNRAQAPTLPDPNTDFIDARTPADVASAVGSGVVGVGGTIFDSFVSAPAEFAATIGSGRTEEILTKERNGVPLNEEDQAYKRTFDFLTQAPTIDTIEGGRESASRAFQQGADFVKTDRAAFAQAEVQQALGESFDNDEFLQSFVGDLADNPLGTLAYVTESIPFMFAAASKATRIPFAVAFTGENYKAGLGVYEEEFGEQPDADEKALILLGSAFIAAINSSAARFVTGEAVAKNLSTRLMKTSVAEYVTTASAKIGQQLTPAESSRLASFLLKASKTALKPALNISTKGAVEFVQEGSEPLITAATARQTLDFTREEKKEAAIGGAIGFAAGGGIGGTVDLVQATGEAAAERQQRVLRERDLQQRGETPTGNMQEASTATVQPTYQTEFSGTAIPIGENYDPLIEAGKGPGDVNDIDSIRENIGHINNSIRFAKTLTEEDLQTEQGTDYLAAVSEQAALLPAYNEQIQELAQRDIAEAERTSNTTEEISQRTAAILEDVYFGSDAPPINTNLVEKLRQDIDTVATQLTAEQLSSLQERLSRAESVKSTEEALRSTQAPTQKSGKTADEVHDEIVNGTTNADGSRKNKGGNTYRDRLNTFILSGDTTAFNKELAQLQRFIKNQQSKLPDNAPARGDTTEVSEIRDRLRNQWPIIASEVLYLQAIEEEAATALEQTLSRAAQAPGAEVVGRPTADAEGGGVASQTGPGESDAPREAQPTASDLAPDVISDIKPEAQGAVAIDEEADRISADERGADSLQPEADGVIQSIPSPPAGESPSGSDEGNRIVTVEDQAGTSREGLATVIIPESNVNLQGNLPVVSAATNKGRDIRSLAVQFKNTAKEIADNIFLRLGVFSNGFDTFLAVIQQMNPELNFKVNSQNWKDLQSVYKRYLTYQKTMNDTGLRQLGKDAEKTFGSNFADNLALGLAVETSPGVFGFRPEVIAAMSIGSALWIKEDSYRTLNVDSFTLEKWFGVDERDIDPAVVDAFRDGGIPRNLIAQSIGQRVYETLDISPKDEAAVGSKEKLIQSLGLITIELMSQRNEIFLTSTGAKDINDKFFGEERDKQSAEARKVTSDNNVKIVTVRVANAPDPETGFDQVHPAFFDPNKNNAAGVYKENPDLGEALFGITRQDSQPLAEPKTTVQQTVRNSPTEITEEQQKAVEDAQKIEHRTNLNTASLLGALGRPFMRKLLGYIPNIEKVSHVDLLDSNEGKNLQIEDSITALLDHIDPEEGDFGNDKPFFFGIFLASNRRSYYESNTFNPQNNTLHRFNVKLNNKPAEIPTDQDADGFIPFLLAITTGLGLQDEKALLKDHIKSFKEFATPEKLAAIDKAIKDQNGNAILALLPESGAHAFQALIELNEWGEASRSDASSFTTDMTMETDGVTNGAAIGFMQLAHSFSLEPMWGWLNRMGIYRKSGPYTGYQQWKATGKNDSYEHMATKVVANLATQRAGFKDGSAQAKAQDSIQNILGDFTDEEGNVSKDARTLMKYPFMIHNYGAGTAKILESIARQVVDQILEEIEIATKAGDISKLNELANDINNIYGPSSIEVTLSLDDALETSLRSIRKRMEKNIVKVIKDPVTEALNDELGDFVKIRELLNEAFQIQFKAFDIEYKKKLKELAASNPEGVALTEGQAREALQELNHLLPGFQGAMVNTKPENRIPVLKTKNVFGNEDLDNIVQIYLNQANKVGAKSAKGVSARKIFVDGGISGAILAIHSLDATVQQRTMEKVRNENGIDIINIWDAGLTDPLSSPIYTEAYNQVFIETMRDYSLLKDVQAMMTAVEETDELNTQIRKDIQTGSGEERAPKFKDLTDFMQQLEAEITLNEQRKAEVFGQALVVEQMVHPNEESQYQYDPAKSEPSPIVFAERVAPLNQVGDRTGFANKHAHTLEAGGTTDLQHKHTHTWEPNGTRTSTDNGHSHSLGESDATGTDENRADTQASTTEQGEEATTVQSTEESIRRAVPAPVEDPLAPVADLKTFAEERLALYPQEIQDMVDEIVVVPEAMLDSGVAAFRINTDGTRQILINDRLNTETDNLNKSNKPWFDFPTRKKLISKIVHHEIGHAIDFALAKKYRERPSEAFLVPAAIKAYRDAFNAAEEGSATKRWMSYPFLALPGGLVNVERSKELFAELYSWYINDRASMIAEQPELADFMEKQYGTIFREPNVESTPTDEEGNPLRGPVSPEVANSSLNKQGEPTSTTASEEDVGTDFNAQSEDENEVSDNASFKAQQSSARQINIDTFLAEQQTTVTSQNVVTIFDSLAGLTAPARITQDFRDYLRDYIGNIIQKGLIPLDKLILNIKSNQSGAFGAISGHNIYMNNNSTRETYSEQSAEEVFAHELTHAITTVFLTKNAAGRRKVRRLYEIARKNITWKDFLKYDNLGNPIYLVDQATEEAQAKATFNYVFNQRTSINKRGTDTNNAIAEFFTYALTNEQMIKKLQTIPTRETKFTKEGNLLDSFLSFMEDAFIWLTETLNNTSGANAAEEISNIVHNIIAAEQNGVFTVLNGIETGFAMGRKPIDISVSYLVNQLAKMISAVASPADRKKLLSFIPNTLRTVSNSILYHQSTQSLPDDNPVTAVVKDATNDLLVAMTSEEGVMRKTMNSLINRSQEFSQWHKLLRNSKHMIDQLRNTVSATIARNVRDRFSQPLTATENKAVTRAFLQADIDSMANFTLAQISQLLTDPKALSLEIRAARNALYQQLTPNERKFINAQSQGLAKLMVHGFTNTFNQSLNADQILNDAGKRDLVPQLDEYISLLALQELPSSASQIAAEVINREEAASPGDNGVTYLQAQHKAFKAESLERLFSGNPMGMTKGYMAEVYDQSVDAKIAKLSDEDWLKSEGYVLIGPVEDDFTALTSAKKGLYIARNNPSVQRLKSIVSVADKAVKGTTLAASSRASGQGYSAVLDALQISRTKAQYNQLAKRSPQAKGHRLIPVKNESGDIVNYRYQMLEEMRDAYLHKDYDIGTVLGAMHASIESKDNSEKINAEAVRVAHGDFIQNFSDEPDKFIAISSDPKSPHFETYKLMPKAMRAEVDRLYGKGQPMRVRAELVDLIFGFRKATLANLPGIKDTPWQHVVQLIENGWQEIIAQEKVNIVIKTVDVMLNNIISNTILLKVMGIPMSDILANTKEAVDGMNQYQHDFEELLALQKELAGDPKKASNPKFISRVEFLRNEIKENPVSELVDEGIFQSITEDIDADQYGDKTKMLDWLQNTVGKHTPAFIQKGIEYAYISENTQAFKFLMKVTQYSDFTARYVMWKHEIAKEGADKEVVLNEIIRTFINYDDPSNKYTQWGNDVGLIMFTKFAIGIQNVIVRLAGKKTANFVTSLLMQEYMGDASDISDSFFLTGGVTHMFHLNPVDHVSNAFAPFGIVTAADYLF